MQNKTFTNLLIVIIHRFTLTIVFKLYVFSYCITIVLSAKHIWLISSLQVDTLAGESFLYCTVQAAKIG